MIRRDAGWFVLDDEGQPRPEPDVLKWSAWYGKADRRVASDMVGETRVSTVFLGLDHSFRDSGPPVLWETMIFGVDHDDYQVRYTSREDALFGHAYAVALARSRLN